MIRTVIAIHGAGEPRRRDGKIYWQPLLGAALGGAYTVRAPRMPHPTKPTYRSWGPLTHNLIAESQTPPVLVGHSFGGSVLLKYFDETSPRPPIAGLFLVATPLWGADFPEIALPAGFDTRLRDLAPIFLYHSRDDAEVPFNHLERLSRALPHATVRALDGRGHEFDQPEFPELVADIRRLDAPSK